MVGGFLYSSRREITASVLAFSAFILLILLAAVCDIENYKYERVNNANDTPYSRTRARAPAIRKKSQRKNVSSKTNATEKPITIHMKILT